MTGKLRIRQWQSGEKSGTSIEIDADALGHDLSWGSVKYTKGTAPLPAREEAESGQEEESSGDLVSVPASAPDRVPEEWSVAPLGTDDSTPF